MSSNLLIAITSLMIMIFLGIDLVLDPIHDIFEEEEIDQNKVSKRFHRTFQRLAYNAYLILNFLHLVWIWINWKYNLKHM